MAILARNENRRERLARWSVFGVVLVLALVLGGSLFEHLVIDTVWPDNVALIQPGQGGVDRKDFWIPIHGALTVVLAVAIWASWRNRPARNLLLIAAGLYVAMRIWTFAYFIPFALEVETASQLTPEHLEEARTWVFLSLLRLPLVVGAFVAAWLAARRLEDRHRVPSAPSKEDPGNSDRVRRIYERLAARDAAGVLELFDSEIEFRLAEGHPYNDSGEPWIGREAVAQRFFRRAGSEWEGWSVSVLRLIEAADTVVVECRYSGTYKPTGRKMDVQVCHVWSFQDGKVRSFHQYLDTAALRRVMEAGAPARPAAATSA